MRVNGQCTLARSFRLWRGGGDFFGVEAVVVKAVSASDGFAIFGFGLFHFGGRLA
jgi:hypothetical protein